MSVSSVEKYREIIDELVRKSFPELKGKKISIIQFSVSKGYAFYIPVLNLIGINRRCANFSQKEKKGLLVHELCHAVQSSHKGFFGNVFLFIKYWIFSKKLKKKIEIQADKLAIQKGYTTELFESTKKFENEFGRMRYGLSQNQIKSYAKKIGKL